MELHDIGLLAQEVTCPECRVVFRYNLIFGVRTPQFKPDRGPEVVDHSEVSQHPDMVRILEEIETKGLLDIFSRIVNRFWRRRLNEKFGKSERMGPDEEIPDYVHCSTIFNCPNCDTGLQLYGDFRPIGIRRSSQQRSRKGTKVLKKKSRDPFMEECEKNGVLPAFLKAVTSQRGEDEVPDGFNLDNHFRNFLISAVRHQPRPEVHRVLSLQLGRKSLEFWKGCNVIMVLSEGRLVEFIPDRLMSKIRNSLRSVNGARVSEPTDLDTWHKTRYGLVPASSRIFLSELREKNSFGQFDSMTKKS